MAHEDAIAGAKACLDAFMAATLAMGVAGKSRGEAQDGD